MGGQKGKVREQGIKEGKERLFWGFRQRDKPLNMGKFRHVSDFFNVQNKKIK